MNPDSYLSSDGWNAMQTIVLPPMQVILASDVQKGLDLAFWGDDPASLFVRAHHLGEPFSAFHG